MELPEGVPPPSRDTSSTAVGGTHLSSNVTLREHGPLGIMWKKHTASPRGTPRDFAVVKSVKKGSSAARAGIRPFEVLMSINGMTVAPLKFDALIETMRKTRPLQLTFAPLERAWLRAEVLFATPGPLGLKLEPSSGDPRAHGVKLKKVLPSSAHANNAELTAGMMLVAMRVGVTQPIQLNNLPYCEVVKNLKAASRPLTLFFDPSDDPALFQSVASSETTSLCSTNGVPTWSRTSEEAVRETLKEHGQDGQLTQRVCEAFSNAQYAPSTWSHELAALHRQNELEVFMASVKRTVEDEELLSDDECNAVPAAEAATDSIVPSIGAPIDEFNARATAAIVAQENFKALTLLENYTEEVLSRLLEVSQTELTRSRQEAAAKQLANAQAVAMWQERAEHAERAEAAARKTLVTVDTSHCTSSPCGRDYSALQEKCEALELRVEYYESRLREKDESHQVELHMRDILLRATELELERAYHGAQMTRDQHASGSADAQSQGPDSTPNLMLQSHHQMHHIDKSARAQTDGNVIEVAPTWPSFLKRELQRLSEEQRQREDQIRAESLAQVAEERAAVDAKHANYEDVVERAYLQVLNVFDMPKFDAAVTP